MHNFADYYFLGKIFKPNGYRGKVNAWLDVDDPSEYESLQMVFLALNGTLVPYFIDSIHILNNKAVIRFQDFDSIEKAEQVNNAEMYLPLADLPKLSGNKFYFHEIIGFVVLDKTRGELGEIRQIFDYPNQAVMQVFYEGKEVLIPINPNVILHLDREKKEILVDAPEGLIDLYLS
ncbi:MAG: ribosome maturation factor RimM [Bacteroidales bacterium]|nr:ribosome maturation factor RimM [Bacteroidales bacterium]MCF6342726.1 ribosome maturation factor RimM [Bacteroidales bacterium]